MGQAWRLADGIRHAETTRSQPNTQGRAAEPQDEGNHLDSAEGWRAGAASMKQEVLERGFGGLIEFHPVDVGQREVTAAERAVWESGIAKSSERLQRRSLGRTSGRPWWE